MVVYIDGKEEVLDTYCGQKTPPQLMSNGVRMKVIFRSESSQKINVSGFKLEYSFRTGQSQFLKEMELGDISYQLICLVSIKLTLSFMNIHAKLHPL